MSAQLTPWYYNTYKNANVDVLKGAFGSEQRVLDLIVPGVMVDSYGDLYYTTADMGAWFGGRSYYIGKIDRNNTWSNLLIQTANILGRTWDKYIAPGYFTRCVWHFAAPCIAQETAYTDCIYVVFNIIPSALWSNNTSHTEGLAYVIVKKSDLTEQKHGYFSNAYHNLYSGDFGHFNLTTYSKNVFTAIHDTDLNKTAVYYLHNFYNGRDKKETNTVAVNYHVFDNNGNASNNFSATNNGQCDAFKAAMEPRIFKVGSEYHFMVSNGIYPLWYKASASTGDTTWHEFNPHTYTLSTGDCCYHTDMQVMQHNGKNLALVMSLVKISHMSGAGISADSKKRWTDDKFVPWNKNYIALVISSWYEGSGYTNIDIPPDNIIEVFPVTTASNAETTSTSTLYKNTYKFVAYTKGAYNYIIYAYCYPGKSKQLYLGICRYWFDSNGHVHLYTKREFRNKKGESFGNLTNCSRIIHMDVKNGHLWVVFMSTDGKKIYYFHAKVDDIVKFAP